MTNVAPTVAERIRRPVPLGLRILRGSLPVVSFGDPDVAVVATLSLNPSWREFQEPSGAWRLGTERRLASLRSIGAEDPRNLDDDQVAQVVAESNAYFRGGNWYKTWFHWLESLLSRSRAGSYLDGSACHLDLVQWATKPAQRDLPSASWNRLVAEDRDFLHWQLQNSNVEVVLINGASVVACVAQADLVSGFDKDVLSHKATNGHGEIHVFHTISDGVLFLGWNKPLAGPVATEGRHRLASWVAEQLRDRVSDGTVDVRAEPADRVGTPGSVDELADGFVSVGAELASIQELERVLSHWTEASDRPTLADVGNFGASPALVVRMGADKFFLNRDTKRAAVRTFLDAAARASGAANLDWHVTKSSRGSFNRVSYRADDAPTPGWYAYVREPSTGPRKLR